jgi:hypothetical protein
LLFLSCETSPDDETRMVASSVHALDGGPGAIAVSTCAELQAISSGLASFYYLTSEIDCTGVSFTPIGTLATPFEGVLDGNGHVSPV